MVSSPSFLKPSASIQLSFASSLGRTLLGRPGSSQGHLHLGGPWMDLTERFHMKQTCSFFDQFYFRTMLLPITLVDVTRTLAWPDHEHGG